MPSSAIRMLCPNLQCRTILAVPVAARGKMVRCRSCGMRVQVPVAATSPAPAQAATSSGADEAKV